RRAPAAAVAAERAPERRREGGGLRRALTLQLVLAHVAAGIAIGVSQSGGETPKIVDRSAVGNDASDTVSKLQSLIDDNTR
ncbi:MAG: hypothetical protein ACJ762_03440, partial [Solirubrobacteraceae bacterium]